MVLTELQKAANEMVVAYKALAGIEKNITEHKANKTLIPQLKCTRHLKKLHELNELISKIYTRILNEIPDDITPYERDYEAALEKVENGITFLEELKKTFPNSPPRPPPTVQSELKLKAIDIPTFDGSYENWYSFSDLFTSMVHNNSSMSDAVKLTHLKRYVSGPAEMLIKNFSVSNNNYTEAWSIMKSRYENKREIVYTHMKNLFNLPRAKHSSGIENLYNKTFESVMALKALGEPVEKWDTFLVYMTVDKFDDETKRQWSLQLTGAELPLFSQLSDFTEQYIRQMHSVQAPAKAQVEKKTSAHFSNHSSSSNGSSKHQCIVCKGAHFIYKCSVFLAMSVKDRNDFASKNRLCFNCLKSSSKGHTAESCLSSGCRSCNRKHNTLLHSDSAGKQQTSSSTSTKTIHHANNDDEYSESDTLLATAVAEVEDPNNKSNRIDVRLLLDNGAKAELITEETFKRCGLKRLYDRTKIIGIGGNEVGSSKGKTKLKIFSKTHPNEFLNIEALILPRVTSDLPNLACETDHPHLQGLPLADPQYHQPGPIDILIGSKYFVHILQDGKITCKNKNGPSALNTIFGWALMGNVSSKQSKSVQINVCDTDSVLQKFFEMEEVQVPKFLTSEEKECEDHFLQNVTRDADGRFCVKLPFNNNIAQLGKSREMAVRRWKAVEKRLARNPEYCDEYSKFMKEYINLGHMSVIPRGEAFEDSSRANYYLPHHFVTKPDSTTTKFRVVFDGSAKSSTGVSLNDCLKVGATLQNDIFGLLLKFRQYLIAIKADRAKMFRQFRVEKSECKFQRIVWRASPSDELEDFELLTVTYGTACAPFLSTRCLIELADSFKSVYPVSSKKLANETYVDDLMSGADTVEEAKQLIKELITISDSACLSFRKWSVSNMEVLSIIPEEFREVKEPFQLDKESNVKALGMQYNPAGDCFSFTQPVFEDTSTPLTKRLVLSQLARVFDPLGLLTPITINAKLFMQLLWKDTMHWDDKLNKTLTKVWYDYIEQLQSIERLLIPRFVKHADTEELTLHGFADASEKAYGACVYVRNKLKTGTFQVKLLCSKSRVAPSKTVSLPRLELCAALLLSELIEVVEQKLNLNCEIYAWSDSMIALQWLASHPGRWQTFVANRVAKIQQIIPFQQWNHVSSEDNPADLISRGTTAAALQNCNLWWHGPSWLSQVSLPRKAVIPKVTATKIYEERKASVHISHVDLQSEWLERFSSLHRLRRVTVFLLRFITKCKIRRSIKLKAVTNVKDALQSMEPITVEELNVATFRIIKNIQQQYFSSEYDNLSHNGEVNKKSKIISLNPILKSGVICVGGRLENADVPDHVKHPIILPHNSHFTTLLIWASHYKHYHGGNKLVWSDLRQKYWILNAKLTIRYVLRRCVRCRRFRSETMKQLMCSLPSSRVTPGRAFEDVGVDYAGPFNLRASAGRGRATYKGYIALFVCMASKAVHLEAVSSLSTDAFLASLDRFVSRRGKPKSISSDCGTNFVGADKELQVLLSSQAHNNTVSDHLCNDEIKWNFNPPGAPHHGGLWEAAVKSTKNHLKKVIGEISLTFEEFYTVLCKIEACLNSRPLLAMSSDPEDFDVLTPGHFLIGQPLTAIPHHDLTGIKMGRLSRWQLIHQLQQHFWRRWKAEYLTTLQQRWKWQTKGRNVTVGDMCVLSDENLPPCKWKLVRVVETHAGTDNLVRTVTIKTPNGNLKRPISKLVPILFTDE